MGATRRELVVMIDGEDEEAQRAWSWGHEAISRMVSTQADMMTTLGGWLEQGHEVLAVQGSDAFLGRVLTCLLRHYQGGSTDLKVFALPATRSRSQVAVWLGEGASMEKRARYLLKASKKGKLKRAHVATLRLSDSVDAAPRYGFNFATGLFYELELIRRRGGVSGATQLASLGVDAAQRARKDSEPMQVSSGVMSRDRREVTPVPRGLLCGALPRALFDIALSHKGGARMVSVEREADALALMARGKAPIATLRGEAGEAFGVLHLDKLERYVFDGEDRVVGPQSITQLSPGPEVMMWC